MKNAADPCGKAARYGQAWAGARIIPHPTLTRQTREHVSPWLRRIAPYMRTPRDLELLAEHRRRMAAYRLAGRCA